MILSKSNRFQNYSNFLQKNQNHSLNKDVSDYIEAGSGKLSLNIMGRNSEDLHSLARRPTLAASGFNKKSSMSQ